MIENEQRKGGFRRVLKSIFGTVEPQEIPPENLDMDKSTAVINVEYPSVTIVIFDSKERRVQQELKESAPRNNELQK